MYVILKDQYSETIYYILEFKWEGGFPDLREVQDSIWVYTNEFFRKMDKYGSADGQCQLEYVLNKLHDVYEFDEHTVEYDILYC